MGRFNPPQSIKSEGSFFAVIFFLSSILLAPSIVLTAPIRSPFPISAKPEKSTVSLRADQSLESNYDTALSELLFSAGFSVPLLRNWGIYLTVPYVQKNRKHDGNFLYHSLGDVMGGVQSRFSYKNTDKGRLLSTVNLGLKMPTGVSDDVSGNEGLSDSDWRRLQPGSGAMDLFFGMVTEYSWLWFTASLLGHYQLKTEWENYKFGDQFQLRGALELPLLKESLTFLLELAYFYEDYDLFKEKEVPLTGKKLILCSPGIKYFIISSALLDFSWEFPLRGKQNNGLSLAHDALIQLQLFF